MYEEKSNSILFFVLKYPPNSIPKDLSGFKFGFGTTTSIKVVHDNTKALSDAITGITADGASYLNLPSGTYLTNKLVIPTKFSLRGNGKNSIVRQQYYATDSTSVVCG